VLLLIKQENMKKLFIILSAAVLTLSVSAQAQFGGVIGLNSSVIGSSESDDGLAMEGGRIGMRFGGVVHIPLGDVVQLRTGAIYSQKGASDSDTDEGSTTKVTIKLDYLEIPMEVAFKLGDAFALSAGPYLAFAMSKSAAIDTDVSGGNEELAFFEALISEVIDENVGGMDFGLNFGASYTIADRFLIGAHYGIGLMDILDPDDDEDFADDEVWINGALSFSFGFIFGGGY
jgi:hypothetical protein